MLVSSTKRALHSISTDILGTFGSRAVAFFIPVNSERSCQTNTKNLNKNSYISRLCDCPSSSAWCQSRLILSSSPLDGKAKCSRTLYHCNVNVLKSSCWHNFHKSTFNPVSIRTYSVQAVGTVGIAESVAHTQAGWFQSLSESTVVSYAQDALVSIHDLTGLPWWASIVLTTLILRTVITMPLAIYQNFIFAKVENLQLEMPEIVKELKMETAFAMKKFDWSEKHARTIYNRSLRKQWKKLVIRDNCHPFKASLLLWVQLPMWVCFSTALRNLVYMLPQTNTAAQIIFLEMSTGGFGWIPNLTIPDASLILPVTFGLVNLAIIEIQSMTRVKQSTKLQGIVTNLFRVLSLVMIPIAASVPSCLCLYWTTSSLIGLSQNLLLLSPKVKRVTGIPNSASQLGRPYTQIAEKIRQRATWLYKPFASK